MRSCSVHSRLRRAGASALAVVLVFGLSVPSLAFAKVSVDETELAQGENAVGGGKATLTDSTLDMVDVVANELRTDESLDMNFNGGNEIENVVVEGDANVEMSFTGENEVEDIYATDNANLTVNADGHNDFEELEGSGSANVTVNVTGENSFEEIRGLDNANVTVQGTDCQMKDTINLGEDEDDATLSTAWGNLTIDHVTVNLEGEYCYVGAAQGDTVIDTSKIAKGDDNEYTVIGVGGALVVRESVIDIEGTMSSEQQMTIEHSDVKVEKPDDKWDADPYRVWSATGIDLIREKNGEVKEGEIGSRKVFYVDTDDGDDVDLEADGDPAYYGCDDDDDEEEAAAVAPLAKALPNTGYGAGLLGTGLAWLIAAAAAVVFIARRLQAKAYSGLHASNS